MNIDRDSNQPSVEMVLHVALGVVLAFSVAVMLFWPQLPTLVI